MSDELIETEMVGITVVEEDRRQPSRGRDRSESNGPNNNQDDSDDGDFKFAKENSTLVLEKQRSSLIVAMKQHSGDRATLRREPTSIQIYDDAPTHFASVHELVQVVAEYLPRKSDVLNAATVNRKWREALLWDNYAQDVKGIHTGGTVRVGAKPDANVTNKWIQYWAMWQWGLWWLIFLGQFSMLMIWITQKDRTPGVENLYSLATAGAIIPSLYLGWHSLMEGNIAVRLCRHQRDNNVRFGRMCGIWLITMFTALTGFATWHMATVGADLMYILDPSRPGGVELQVTDTDGGWNTDVVFAGNSSLVKINDPGNWVQLPATPILTTKKRGVCLVRGRNKKVCVKIGEFDTLDYKEIRMWQYQGAATSKHNSNPSSCTNPVKDRYPNRTIFLDVSRTEQQRDNDVANVHFKFSDPKYSPHLKFGEGGPAMPPHGVERVNAVLMNLEPTSTLNGTVWSMSSLSGAAAKLQDAKWKSVVFYDLALSSTSDSNFNSEFARHGISWLALTPAHLNATLAAAPYSLSLSERATIFNTTANAMSRTSLLRYWISRAVLGDSGEEATVFSGAQEVMNTSHYNKYRKTQPTRMLQYRLPRVSWSYSVPGSNFFTDQAWSIFILPSPGKCSFPTLTRVVDPGQRHSVTPMDQPAGGYIYTGDYSFWYRGRSYMKGAEGQFAWFPHVPVMGGAYAMPGWCTDYSRAQTFFVISLVLFLLPAAISLVMLCEFCYRVVAIKERTTKTKNFKDHAGKWWKARAKHLEEQNKAWRPPRPLSQSVDSDLDDLDDLDW